MKKQDNDAQVLLDAEDSKQRIISRPDVEFFIDGTSKLFVTFGEACEYAVARSVMTGNDQNIDVAIYSPEGAAAWGGDDAVEVYNDDPDCSVFERIKIRASSLGKVP